MSEEIYDLAILGGGFGGMTAAIYAGRAHLKTLLIEKGAWGGQINDSIMVENYPGLPGLPGRDLTARVKEHAMRFSDLMTTVTSRIESLSVREDGVKVITTKRKGSFLAQAVIISVGCKPRVLGIPGEVEFSGNGVSYCATCDGEFYTDKTVAVLGAGNSAIQNALLLTNYAKEVIVVVMNEPGHLDCNEAEGEEALSNEKMRFVWNSTISSINGSDTVTGITIKNVLTGKSTDRAVDGVFSFVGMVPQTEFLQDSGVQMDKSGYIPVGKDKSTNIPGVYAVGDCTDTLVRQAITAAGDGCVAEQMAEAYVKESRAVSSILSAPGAQAIIFYSPYDNEGVSRLQPTEDALASAGYHMHVIDISRQRLLYDRLGLTDPMAVALYEDGNLKRTIALTGSDYLHKLASSESGATI
ncbi:MAG: FAD-dependent oxidoreductase [Actinomycetaceae bacterium]|nr:FAD-dependent oxidoreductase [Actinomycetaceae bacterium]MDY6083376.1 FAD-dependent oxidoreductase [Actinomycetaceae bacterium]